MNEPVFPIKDLNEHPGPLGLTVRDYFAAKAMNGHFSSATAFSPTDLSDWYLEEVASAAYMVADAMLKARAA